MELRKKISSVSSTTVSSAKQWRGDSACSVYADPDSCWGRVSSMSQERRMGGGERGTSEISLEDRSQGTISAPATGCEDGGGGGNYATEWSV